MIFIVLIFGFCWLVGELGVEAETLSLRSGFKCVTADNSGELACLTGEVIGHENI